MVDARAMTGAGGVVLEDDRHLDRFEAWLAAGPPGLRCRRCGPCSGPQWEAWRQARCYRRWVAARDTGPGPHAV
ncbi:hypothetical protein [Ideonella oryzae]|uniref:Uncharacterized protein n=1 Tax=Ideonella oryzae TaxID=2937441 RepID=A0ABT1BHD6_9BURK|nr:hypothetical protein [Ideonella oryzae]MCO5975508.1 hypothetical protein [Ideonella oryzae]